MGPIRRDMKKTGKSISYYPVFLNLTGKKCIVAGGGNVALRKVQSLLDSGADIRIISSRVCAGLAAMEDDGKLAIARKKYEEGDLDGAYTVIAATGNHALNRKIAVEARGKRLLVNVVDDPANCDFIVPSVMHRGDIAVAVSTGGKSPALARKLRSRLEKEFGEEYSAIAGLISEVRLQLRDRGVKITSEKWQHAIDLDLLAGLVKKGSTAQAKEILKRRLLGTTGKQKCI